MPDRTIPELLEDHRAGDADAFGGLLDHFQGPLLRYARFLAPDMNAAEDVVQDVFFRLAKSPPDLPHDGQGDTRLAQAHLSSWLFRVTRNRVMELLRSDARRKVRERAAAPRESIAPAIPLAEARDIREVVEQGLMDLPTSQRDVLVLRLLGNQSYKDIAALTGKPAGTIAWLISEGLKSLSKNLAPKLAPETESPAPPSAIRGGTTR